MTKPLVQTSEVVDTQRRWMPTWYSWLTQIAGRADGALQAENNLSDVDDVAEAFDTIKQAGTLTNTGVLAVASDADAKAGVDGNLALTPMGLTAALGLGRFHIDRGGLDQTGATASAFNKVNFNFEELDSEGWFSGGRFTPLLGGWYWIYLSVGIPALASAETTQALIRRNGSNYALSPFMTNVGLFSGGMSVQSLVPFNGISDFVEGFAWCPTGITTIDGGTDRTFMGGWRVGV